MSSYTYVILACSHIDEVSQTHGEWRTRCDTKIEEPEWTNSSRR